MVKKQLWNFVFSIAVAPVCTQTLLHLPLGPWSWSGGVKESLKHLHPLPAGLGRWELVFPWIFTHVLSPFWAQAASLCALLRCCQYRQGWRSCPAPTCFKFDAYFVHFRGACTDLSKVQQHFVGFIYWKKAGDWNMSSRLPYMSQLLFFKGIKQLFCPL